MISYTSPISAQKGSYETNIKKNSQPLGIKNKAKIHNSLNSEPHTIHPFTMKKINGLDPPLPHHTKGTNYLAPKHSINIQTSHTTTPYLWEETIFKDYSVKSQISYVFLIGNTIRVKKLEYVIIR